MKIGLNAISFVPGRMGGMETYFRNLVNSLQQCDTDNRYTLFCDERFISEFPLFNKSFTIRNVNYAKPSLNWFVRGIMRNFFNQDILQRAMRSSDVDVMHHPFTVLTPPGVSIPTVLTFWDMQQEFFPEFFSPVELRKRKRTFRASAEEATRIIVSARYTKQCLIEKYAIEAEKIRVIYTGYGSDYRLLDDDEELARLRDKYGLGGPFLYYPAATWPHKNHKNLFAALKILRDERRFDGQLVLTGVAMRSHGEILAELARLDLTASVKVLGYLDYAELPYIYNLATMLVFPSFFEGFGIPLVEAMACGCPVVCSNTTSLPEIVGEAGLLFDPGSPRDIAEKIWQVWTDDALRSRMKTAGLGRIALFDWQETARKTLEVYREAAGALI
jgi:glycosyltransferase involved in cell wall biosynthesis